MKTSVISISEQNEQKLLSKARKIMSRGGLVAFPTETVYGLGGNALKKKAAAKIYKAKGRPSDNPLIVHIAEIDEVYSLASEIPDEFFKLAESFWPGPLTMILKKSSIVPDETTGALNTVAIRMPSHPIARKLISSCGFPIAAPSANSSGKPSPTSASHVFTDLNGKIPLIIDGGDCQIGIESTVLSLAGDKPLLLRPGAITKEMIESVIGEISVSEGILSPLMENEVPQSPGMKYKHYSPKADVTVVEGSSADFIAFLEEIKSEVGAYALCYEEEAHLSPIPYLIFGKFSDELSQASALFSALREFDEMEALRVYAHSPKTSGISLAVYNRLIRAAGFKVIKVGEK